MRLAWELPKSSVIVACVFVTSQRTPSHGAYVDASGIRSPLADTFASVSPLRAFPLKRRDSRSQLGVFARGVAPSAAQVEGQVPSRKRCPQPSDRYHSGGPRAMEPRPWRSIRAFNIRGARPQALAEAERDDWLLIIEGAAIRTAAHVEMLAGTTLVFRADVPPANVTSQHEHLLRACGRPPSQAIPLSLLRCDPNRRFPAASAHGPLRSQYAPSGRGALVHLLRKPHPLACKRLFSLARCGPMAGH